MSPQEWIKPYLSAYVSRYGERASPQAVRRIAKGMRTLETAFPRDEVLKRWPRYLRATELHWYSVERFAETWPEWGVRKFAQTPYKPVSKSVEERIGQRVRLIQVPIDDPRPAV